MNESIRRLSHGWAQARKRRSVRWGIDALVMVLVFAVVGALQTRRHLGSGTAPELRLSTLEGDVVDLASLRGKPTLVVFWAPWCAVCKVESQNVSWAMHLAGAAANVVSVVSEFDELADVRSFAVAHDVDYPVLLGTRTTSSQFSIGGFPTIYFLDAEGRVKSSAVGYTTTLGLLVRLFL